MVCLVVEHSPEVRNRLCLLLLDFGILGVPAATKSEAEDVMSKRSDISAAIVDMDDRDVDGARLLPEIRRKGIRSIAHTLAKELRAEIRPLADAVLAKPFDETRTGTALRGILAPATAAAADKRQHLRVAPDPVELLRASFRITASSRLYSGRVRNISLGGAAIEVFKGPPDSTIQVGWRIPRLEFNLGTTPLAPAAVIVLYKRMLVAVRFETMSAAERRVLAQYVYDRLTATSGRGRL